MEVSSSSSGSKRSRAATKPKVITKPSKSKKNPLISATPAVAIAAPTAAESAPNDIGTMVAEAAYYLAAQRDFAPGRELDDWLAAEQSIKAAL